jgi:hypothetical protein
MENDFKEALSVGAATEYVSQAAELGSFVGEGDS